MKNIFLQKLVSYWLQPRNIDSIAHPPSQTYPCGWIHVAIEQKFFHLIQKRMMVVKIPQVLV